MWARNACKRKSEERIFAYLLISKQVSNEYVFCNFFSPSCLQLMIFLRIRKIKGCYLCRSWNPLWPWLPSKSSCLWVSTASPMTAYKSWALLQDCKSWVWWTAQNLMEAAYAFSNSCQSSTASLCFSALGYVCVTPVGRTALDTTVHDIFCNLTHPTCKVIIRYISESFEDRCQIIIRDHAEDYRRSWDQIMKTKWNVGETGFTGRYRTNAGSGEAASWGGSAHCGRIEDSLVS